MAWEKIYEGDRVEIFKVAPDIYFRKADLKVRGQCNGAFLVGKNEVAIVDTPPAAAELIDEALALFGKPVKHVFLTHGHGDHCEGLVDFLDKDVTIYCAQRLLERLDPGAHDFGASFVGVEGTVALALSGGIQIELFTMGGVTHSPWDMFIRVPNEGVLIAGDAVVEFQTAYLHNADAANWISALRKLAAQNGRWVLAGHADEPYPYGYVGKFADFLDAVRNGAQECLAEHKKAAAQGGKPQDEDVNAAYVANLVDAYFARGGDTAQYLEGKAGGDARREVRMLLWTYLKEIMR